MTSHDLPQNETVELGREVYSIDEQIGDELGHVPRMVLLVSKGALVVIARLPG